MFLNSSSIHSSLSAMLVRTVTVQQHLEDCSLYTQVYSMELWVSQIWKADIFTFLLLHEEIQYTREVHNTDTPRNLCTIIQTSDGELCTQELQSSNIWRDTRSTSDLNYGLQIKVENTCPPRCCWTATSTSPRQSTIRNAGMTFGGKHLAHPFNYMNSWLW